MSLVQQNGGSFFRPLFYDFPNDDGAYEDQELNIMLGPSLKLGIQSTAVGVKTTDLYFPAGNWCDIFCNMDVGCCLN